MNAIDEKLIKILNSKCTNKDYISNIKYLFNANVLTNDESKLCDFMLEQLEIIGAVDFSLAMSKFEINITDGSDINGYNKLEVLEKLDEFISQRKREENNHIYQSAIEQAKEGIISKQITDLFFNRYVDAIKIKKSNTLENLKTISTNLSKIEISTGSYVIDNMIEGLSSGSITTIVGNNVESKYGSDLINSATDYKGLWALNIAYNALEKGKNVLYFALGKNEEDIYKRFLSRHSCNSKFEKPLTVQEITNSLNAGFEENSSTVLKEMFEINKNLCNLIHEDFLKIYKNKLIIFDEKEFDISTHHNLQRLIVYAQKEFISNLNTTIDLIIIDDFSCMKLDSNRRSITNKNVIANEYYKYLRRQAKNLLGTEKSIPIVLTISASDGGTGASRNAGNYSLNFVLDEVKIQSDNIMTVYGDKNLKASRKLKLQVIKSNKKIMEEAAEITSDCQYWQFEQEINYFECPDAQSCICNYFSDLEIKDLKNENAKLKKSLNKEDSDSEITLCFDSR